MKDSFSSSRRMPPPSLNTVKQHACPFENCTLTFTRPYRLRIHVQWHQGIKEFQCAECDRGYHRKQHLQRHIAEAHRNQSRLEHSLPCDHCDRSFDTAWGLRRHQMKMKQLKPSNVREHCCKMCPQRFYTADDLERHSFKHERFRCDVPSCPLLARQFKWKSYHRHMIDYHSEPFECEHCGQKFLIKSQVRRHVRQHMPKFHCTQPGCDKTFAFANNLTHHVQVGHGQRIHKCTVVGCDWEFKYKSCLNRHIKIHQQNGRIVPMANRFTKKEPKLLMAKKLAALALKKTN